MINNEYIDIIVANYIKDWFNYNNDVCELSNAMKISVESSRKIVSKCNIQFICN